MKKIISLLLLVFTMLVELIAQPTTFNYQAVVRDIGGSLITEQQIILRLSITDIQETIYYEEEHQTSTNEFGQIQIEVGGGTLISGNFGNIPWGSDQLLLNVDMSMDQGTTFTNLGQSPLLGVPYAFYAASGEPGNGIESVTDNGDGTLTFHFTDGSSYTTPNLAGPALEDQPGNLIYHDSTGWVGTDAIKIAGQNVAIGTNPNLSRLLVHGDILGGDDDPIFEVKNRDGNVVFAVYQNGVEVNVDESTPTKGIKGGFAVGGLTSGKDSTVQYFRVTPDSVRIYLKEDTTRGIKGGFAVGGLTSGKGLAEYLRVTPDSTRVYVNTSTKGIKGGFAVGGLTSGKDDAYFMDLTPENYFIGHRSGSNIEGGLYNSVLGFESGLNLTNGASNAFIGHQSGYMNTEGDGNLFLGYQSGYSNITGDYNTFLGYKAGYSNTFGISNTFLGSFSGQSNVNGGDNTFVGDSTGISNIYGRSNTFLGTNAGYSNVGGNYNIFIGYNSGYSNQNAGSNVFLGNETGMNSVGGWNNIYLGTRSGHSNVDGQGNVMIGYESGMNNIYGNGNIFIGASAGLNEKGDQKLYVGYGDSTLTMIWGDQQARKMRFNSRIGINDTPDLHTLSMFDHVNEGSILLSGIGGENYFTSILFNSNQWSGDYGYKLAHGRDHSFSILLRDGENYFTRFELGLNGNIGINTYPHFANLTILNETDPSHLILTGLGNEYDYAMLSLYRDMDSDTLGFQFSYTTKKALVISQKDMDGSDARLKINKDGNVMINSWDNPTQTLDVNGNARFRQVGSGASANDLRIMADGTLTTSTSDLRLKYMVKPIQNSLKKILQLNGYTFLWKNESNAKKDAGLVAQEVQHVFPEAVFKNPIDGYYGINYSKFSALFVEAFKEQEAKINKLEKENQYLKQKITEILKKLSE